MLEAMRQREASIGAAWLPMPIIFVRKTVTLLLFLR